MVYIKLNKIKLLFNLGELEDFVMKLMPYAAIWPLQLAEWLIKYIKADKRTRKMMLYVPDGCMNCELLGICRDEEQNWKCTRGCMANWYSKKSKK